MEDPRGVYGGDRAAVRRRRPLLALAVFTAIGGGIWLLFFRGGSDDPEQRGQRAGAVSEAASETAAGLSTEQLADQVLLLGFDGTDDAAPVMDELGARQIGGVLIRPQNWLGAEAGASLTEAIRTAGASGGPLPPLIVGSQEGGEYRSFADLPSEQTELEIGDTGSIAVAEKWAVETSAALRDAGFDLNLFPVADVATLDSPIADRAFSDDPLLAAQLTAGALRGCRTARIACAPLHFPGLGAASQDTSRGPATVSLDPAGLSARDLEPFRAAVGERAPALVLSLAFYAAYDPVTPGALTGTIATDLLREQLGFEGVAITDDLGSGAVRSAYSVADAAVAALRAGADVVQLAEPEDQGGVREAIVAAVASGELAEERLAEAAGRVLELKGSLEG